ncbi:hypothetical protein [Coralloluteibacterium stylophorae]|uniref:Uncharacterized protein n=1 Tax=Coralloluteibacterium stylophorae TaxID=1776034 RepID=A0A8J7VSF5_9GAMM|nr:hypothetical protein [Coralloluteibacterium stylophorae]MBS7457159.1 hypothetical protein [Coralloluteibacterium stylophorae]
MDVRKGLRIMGWLAAGCVALVLGLYVVLLVVNRSDEPPSADAVAMRALIEERPDVADADNGYVYALGLLVADGQDPVAQGATRMDFLERLGPGDAAADDLVFEGERRAYRNARSDAVAALADACMYQGAECAQQLERAPDAVSDWKASETWLLARYRELIERSQWRGLVPIDASAPLQGYQGLLDGQQLLLLDAWRQATAGDAAGVRDVLQQDLAFWRMVLRSSDRLIAKMMAVNAIDRHFALGNLALRALPAEQQAAAIPPSWREPIDREERALYRPLAGDWRLSQATVHHAVQLSLADMGLIDRLAPRFFQPQASSNLLATALLDVARAYDVEDLGRVPQVMEERRNAAEVSAWRTLLHPYNTAGHILVDIARPAYADYGVRAADLEGVRRAALLAATLRSQGIAASQAASAVAASPLTDPYTGAALQWDDESGSVVFHGLAKGERSRRMLLL